MSVRIRTAARGLVMAPSGRVLLAQMNLPWLGPVWLPPGGGLKDGEGLAKGLRRELAEETGLQVDLSDLGRRLWRRHLVIEHEGRVEMDETYVLVETEEFEPTPTLVTPREQAWMMGWRWWWPAEILRSEDRFEPPELGKLLMKRAVSGFGPFTLLPARHYRTEAMTDA